MMRSSTRVFRTIGRTLVAFGVTTACHTSQSSVPTATPTATVNGTHIYDPARELGAHFHDIQLARIFPDSKTLVDARPRVAPAELSARYERVRHDATFSLRAFVDSNFDAPDVAGGSVRSDTTQTMDEHIRSLWPMLTRAADAIDPRSSLIPLPGAYVVPGGRFREVYYWDSYFTMLGLVQDGRTDLVKNMLDNFAYLVRTVGHIPNGNRSYYLSRSQPPYFSAMVGLYAAATDSARATAYLDAMEAEHDFWMAGAEQLPPGSASRRVVRMADGSVLNRYWDDRPEPRPESYREDYLLAQAVPAAEREGLYRNIRAAAESGWDFSSRWMRDPADLRSLETTELIPVDLNSLLYHAERTIAALRRVRGGTGDADAAARYETMASRRRSALLAASYDAAAGLFFDVRWRTGARVTDRPTMAAASPLYFGLATPEQGRAVAARLARDFLKPGGFATTLVASGQQWDSPNGWPPLQWLGGEAVRRYGRADIADDARNRWLALNRRTYRVTGRMMEKYDVTDLSRSAGGGEYPTQDGFGWTNGVAQAMAAAERAAATPAGARP
jgi:alpha,alpha-trehalase